MTQNNIKGRVFVLFCLFFALIPFIQAETSTYNAVLVVNNDTYRNQMFVVYNAEEFTRISAGEGVNFYVSYTCNPYALAEYNRNYPTHNIKNITITFDYQPVQNYKNGSTVSLERNITTIELNDLMPFPELKHFFTIYDKESVIIRLDTQFINADSVTRDSICSFKTVLGTEGCSKCQELRYYEFVQDVNEGNVIQNYNNRILTKIQNVSGFLYEFVIILYWIMIIAIFLVVMGLLFYTVFWAYHFLSHLFKR